MKTTFPLLVLATLLAGCSTQKIHARNRVALATARASLEAEELATASAQAESVLVASGNVASEYALQRFFASYLMTRAHMQAVFGKAFLREPVDDVWAGTSEGASSRPSPVSHLVATTYHGTYALGALRAARAAPVEVDGEPCLPQELLELGVGGAGRYIKLGMLTVYSRLQYQEQVDQVLASIEGSTDLARLDAMLDETSVSAAMRPWIYRAVFESVRRSDERAAYRFAIRALDASANAESDFGEDERKKVEEWITGGSAYVFRCPECPDSVVNVAYPLCTKCRNVERIDFIGEPRE